MKSTKMKETLPDEILVHILQIGVDKSILTCTDISSVSLSCKNLNKLSEENTLWSTLITLDFPFASSQFNNIPNFPSKRNQYKYILKCHLQLKIARCERRLERLDDRRGLLERKIKRRGRELRFLDVQMNENSGQLLDMIHDRYVICYRELVKVEKKHTHAQNKVTSTLSEISKMDYKLRVLSRVCDGADVLVNDEASSSDDSEYTSEAESENSS